MPIGVLLALFTALGILLAIFSHGWPIVACTESPRGQSSTPNVASTYTLVELCHDPRALLAVYAFRKGVRPGSFSKSLNHSRPKTFAEVTRKAVEHIASEGEAYEKCTTAAPARPRAQIRTQPARVHEAATERRDPDKKRTYETRRTQPRVKQKEGEREIGR